VPHEDAGAVKITSEVFPWITAVGLAVHAVVFPIESLTVNGDGEEALPPTDTTTAADPTGTSGMIASMAVSAQLTTVADAEPKLTMLFPWLAPKPVPMIVTLSPTFPVITVSPNLPVGDR
jgi:hypothetical protein